MAGLIIHVEEPGPLQLSIVGITALPICIDVYTSRHTGKSIYETYTCSFQLISAVDTLQKFAIPAPEASHKENTVPLHVNRVQPTASYKMSSSQASRHVNGLIAIKDWRTSQQVTD